MKAENGQKRRGISSWFGRAGAVQDVAQKDEYERLCEEIEAARQEWAIAQQHIDCVSEPELIDHAIYYLEAAERKYGYLLREAKKKFKEKSRPSEVAKIEPSL